jgi:hypothetical protein
MRRRFHHLPAASSNILVSRRLPPGIPTPAPAPHADLRVDPPELKEEFPAAGTWRAVDSLCRRSTVSDQNETRPPPTKMDRTTLIVLVVFGVGLALLIALNMN